MSGSDAPFVSIEINGEHVEFVSRWYYEELLRERDSLESENRELKERLAVLQQLEKIK